MWLKTICLLCVCLLPVFAVPPEPKTPASPTLEWSTEKPYQYLLNVKIIDQSGSHNFANGFLSLQWKSEKILDGSLWLMQGTNQRIREPFTATFSRGQVKDLKVSPDIEKWNIELIRAALSQIQISDLINKRENFTIMEESVSGKCQTQYIFVDENTIKKVKDYTNCEKVPVYERGVFGKDNWEALMKKQDIIKRTSETEIILNAESFPEMIETVEQIEIESENSKLKFQTQISLIFGSFEFMTEIPDDELISVGGLMFQPKPQKRFCNKNGGLNRNEIEQSCEVDYYMNPKYLKSSNDEYKVDKARDLIEKIAQDLENPSEVPKTNMMDRFTILVGVIRRLNVKELEELTYVWDLEKSESFVYQSALIAAGTLDSLLMIKNLKKYGGLRSDVDVTEMPSAVHPLTLEYLDTFFEFATDPQLMQDDFDFSKDLILDFTNLLRRYITEKEKPFEMEQLNRLILKKYRKYFSNQLQENLNKNDLKFQVYVRAVGNMADLSLFNYLLSLKPGKLSPFQKTLVVNSMDKTLELYPAKTRVMLAKLYENEDENNSVRIAAMYQLFKTDLPNDMVLDVIRVAKGSYDKDIQNAVKTTVLSHAYSYHLNEEISELAEELNPEEAPGTVKKERYSMHKFQDNSDNVTKSHNIIEYVKSYGEGPLSMFFKKITDRKGFKTDFKMSGMFNNLEEFIRGLNSPSTSAYPMRGYVEKLKTKLSSANFEIDTDFRQLFLPFENLSSGDFTFLEFLQKDQQLNDAMLSMEEVEIAFPTEIGFPFLYSHQSPEYFKYDISTNVEDTFTMNIHWIWSHRRQTKMGIVNPLTGKYHVVGVDMNQQINIPITISYNSFFGTFFIVSIDPLLKNGNQRILHLGTWPFVGQRDIFPLVPTAEDENIFNVIPDDITTAKQYLDDSDRFLLQAKSSKINSTSDVTEFFTAGELEAYEYFGPFGEAFPKHNLFNIFFKEDKNSSTSLIFTLDFSSDKMIFDQVNNHFGKIRGPFLFMGKELFEASISLTGPTNRSVIVSASQASDFLTNTVKITISGSYSENGSVTLQGCYDTVIADQRTGFRSIDENKNLVIHIRMRGGKTCEEGGMITLETEVDAEKVQKDSKIEAEVMVDFKDVPDEIAVEICKLSQEDYSNVENINLKFVQKNEELCEELTSEKNENKDRESIEDVEATTINNEDVVEVMWEESAI